VNLRSLVILGRGDTSHPRRTDTTSRFDVTFIHHSDHIHQSSQSCFRMWLSYFLLGHSFNESPCTTHLHGVYSLFDCPLYSSTARHTDLAVMCYESYGTLHIFKALSCHLPREKKVNEILNQDSQLTWFNTENSYILATCALSPGQVLTLS
jgi:hypothetical protein